jgi:tRNA G46 methylase TrmB
MPSIPRRDIEAALKKKGFIAWATDHRYYSLWVDGRETSVRTKISTGTGYEDYVDDLLGKVKRQLHLRSLDDLRDFVNCPMTYEAYLSELRLQGVI